MSRLKARPTNQNRYVLRGRAGSMPRDGWVWAGMGLGAIIFGGRKRSQTAVATARGFEEK
jgi:hypothetical protein